MQINFPLHQQQFDTQSRRFEEPQAPQGFIDETGSLCLLEFEEKVDGVVKEPKTRHGTREKSRSSQKRRKKKKTKQQAKKELGK